MCFCTAQFLDFVNLWKYLYPEEMMSTIMPTLFSNKLTKIEMNSNYFNTYISRIEEEEFAIWIRESDEIQDFLLKYTGQ